MSKLFKKDTKPFLNVLYKLTDERFKFSIIHSFKNGAMGYNINLKGE